MKLKKLLSLLGFLAALATVTAARHAGLLVSENQVVTETEYRIDFALQQALFGTEVLEEVTLAFFEEYPDSTGFSVPSKLLEDSFEALPYVKKAKVNWNLDQRLVVRIEAHQAMARVMNRTGSHLWNLEGAHLPDAPGRGLSLPIITGATDSVSEHKAWQAFGVLNRPEYGLSGKIAQMEYSEFLITVVPQHSKVVIKAHANPILLAGELEKLQLFYAGLGEEEIEKLKSIDLRYTPQVVTTSHTNP